ncbi:hypothetical protein [Segetibacter sp. 3557_3]|uniref:hypothetical protein n=1 Tax=Segetibacter sp. 3557_3 TaxID=2547429 RepID=UPI00397E2161
MSTPLEWREIKPGLDPSLFTIDTIFARLEKKGDLFAAVNDRKIASTNSKRLKLLL